MKATKLLLGIILMLFCLNSMNAQVHLIKPDVNCKFNKVKYGTEAGMCPACENIKQKESEAKAAEDKRRTDAMIAKAKAEKEAAEKARLDKLKQIQEEEEKRKAKEEADRIASEAIRKKYEEIAKNGVSKTKITGNAASDLSTLNLIPFNDDVKKVYGFRIDSTELVTLPYGDFSSVWIDRIANSNYFSLRFFWKGNFHHSSIINYLGEVMKIDGISDFDNDIHFHTNTSDNTIYLNKRLSPPEYVVDVNYLGGCCWSYYENKESAVAFLKSRDRDGDVGVFRPNYVTYVTRYTVDLDLQLLEKKNVYVAGSEY